MKTKTKGSYQAGLFERDYGIATAAASAGEVWMKKAEAIFKEFLAPLPPGRRFMIEQVRAFAYERGLGSPPSERAWGSVTLKIVRDGIISRWGYGQVTNARAHMANATIWQKTKPLRRIK